jgi:DNA-binding response OmpR family regulator
LAEVEKMKENLKKLIAVVDDEPDILKLISFNLEKENFMVKTYENGRILFEKVREISPDLIVLDIMLPGMDGFEICRKLKNQDELSSIPVIMLSAKDEVIDKVVGLELGADDYLAKPFEIKELVARIKAVLRRGTERKVDGILYLNENLKMNLDKYEVHKEKEKINLTITEFKILQILGQKKGIVFSREKILNALWGNEKWVFDRTIDVHIRNIRKKLNCKKDIIENIRGVGYRIRE